MSIRVSDLKESNEFLNILFENITSAVFIVDKEYKIQSVNSTFELLFDKTSEEITGNLCGDVIGCGFTFDDNKSCGSTSHCKSCDLRRFSFNSINKKQTAFRKTLTRDFIIGEQRLKKYFLYSTKPIHFENNDMAMIIVDDVTETEQQKQLLQDKNKEITQSIHYARGIQKTILPHNNTIKKILPNSFVFYLPKDIISGDFYWVTQSDNLKYIAVADCTGHGVPGAIMSILGITLLNEIIRSKKHKNAGEILDKLRSEIIQSLRQQGVSGEHKDGMDIALCIIDSTENKKNEVAIQFAGANSSAYIVHSPQPTINLQQSAVKSNADRKMPTGDCRLTEIKGDKMPIGIHDRMVNFGFQKLKIKKDDCIYLFSDGIADQFGGPHKKKFKTSRLREFLCSIYDQPMSDQQHDLEIEFLKWKGNNEQVDDVTVAGVRV